MMNERAHYESLFGFAHGLTSLVKARVSLPDALATLQAQSRDATWQEAIAFLRAKAEDGETLSRAMWQREDFFPKLLIALVGAGDVTGRLEQTLPCYAEYLRKELELSAARPRAKISPTHELALWCRRLGILWRWGVPILPMLEISVGDPPTSDALREAVLIVRQAVREGGHLAEKMAEFPDVFPPSVRQLIAIGEETGSLDDAALRLADMLEMLEPLPESAPRPAAAPQLPLPAIEAPERAEAGHATAKAILQEAIRLGASDVHLQPGEESVHARCRVDGALRTTHTFQRDEGLALIARLKSMAKLNAADRRLPQRGSMAFSDAETGEECHLRVMTYPFEGGEGVTVRVHPRGAPFTHLTELGMTAEQAEECMRLLRQPAGIVAVTGARGSGKTTTLYTLLRTLHREGVTARRAVVTLESPVEAPLEGVTQVSLDASLSLTFAEGMQGVMQQDPDILMVGDVRDAKEMAEVCRAAQGHLLLIGVTAGDAVSAPGALWGSRAQQGAGQLLAVIAQRLTRKLCDECSGSGCDACGTTGYRGRTGVFEIHPGTTIVERDRMTAQQHGP